MSNNNIKFKYRKENAILSDTLPFEIPASFTNRHFYLFILENQISIDGNQISWRKRNIALDEIIKLMFGLKNKINENKNGKNIQTYKLEKGASALIPFKYNIRKGENEFRELTIPHPINQIELANFYDSCKESIIYHCSGSSFSIRKPTEVQRQRDYIKSGSYKDSSKNVMQYKTHKTFFKNKKYNSLYQFYNSHYYYRAGKKYNRLLKLDISDCFDSIYTHSLPWAVLGKHAVKKSLNESKKTFSGRFDRLMQSMNYNETNGIIVGPEFPRIFAEILLQMIDKKLEESLKKEGLKHKVNYEIFRYVDDYFIFYNSEDEREKITTFLKAILLEYKLRINPKKEIVYDKPMITEVSIAVEKIKDFLEKNILFPNFNGETSYIECNKLVLKFEMIIKESGASYDAILNPAFVFMEKKFTSFLKYCKNYYEEYGEGEDGEIIFTPTLEKNIYEFLNFMFYIYSASPKVNATVRLCRIISIIIELADMRPMDSTNKHYIYSYIYDGIIVSLNRTKAGEDIKNRSIQIETLYLLNSLFELGENYGLEEKKLAEYFNIERDKEEKIIKYKCDFDLNYFSLVTILLYMKNNKKYDELKRFIEEKIKQKILSCPCKWKNTESIMLTLDIISCPFVSGKTKNTLLRIHGIKDKKIRKNIIDYKNEFGRNQLWFTTWNNFYFAKELDTKKRERIY